MFPELHTERFYLKKILAADQAFIFKGLSDPEVIPFYGVRYDSFEATKAQMEFYNSIWEERTGCWWKIVDKTSNEPVGACGMNNYMPEHEKAEVGYWLLPSHWKKGIMPEVIPVMIGHLFKNWKLHRLEAVIEPGNDSSCRLSEKLGFTYEGTLREAEMKYGKRISLMVYSLLATE
ncbi:MAG TPA: GNAT family protein, partial [Chitinophagaceae bacterium]